MTATTTTSIRHHPPPTPPQPPRTSAATLSGAHAMEDVFVAVQDGKEVLVSERVDQLLSGTDLLRSLSELDETAIEGGSTQNGPRIAETIAALEKAVAPGSPIEAPPPVEAPGEVPEEVPAEVSSVVEASAGPPAPTPPAVSEVSETEYSLDAP